MLTIMDCFVKACIFSGLCFVELLNYLELKRFNWREREANLI